MKERIELYLDLEDYIENEICKQFLIYYNVMATASLLSGYTKIREIKGKIIKINASIIKRTENFRNYDPSDHNLGHYGTETIGKVCLHEIHSVEYDFNMCSEEKIFYLNAMYVKENNCSISYLVKNDITYLLKLKTNVIKIKTKTYASCPGSDKDIIFFKDTDVIEQSCCIEEIVSNMIDNKKLIKKHINPYTSHYEMEKLREFFAILNPQYKEIYEKYKEFENVFIENMK